MNSMNCRMNNNRKKAQFCGWSPEHGLYPTKKDKEANQREYEKAISKYMEIVPMDNFELRFMGFLNYKKAFTIFNEQSLKCENPVQGFSTTKHNLLKAVVRLGLRYLSCEREVELGAKDSSNWRITIVFMQIFSVEKEVLKDST
ncbi:hypothetical protein AAG906_008510 [Vitis piasezkii]